MDKSRLNELCKKNKITISELEKSLNLSNGSLRKDGDIKSERLLAISDFFGVSMEYLMGRDFTQYDQKENEYMALIEKYRNADDSVKRIIEQLLDFALEQENKNNDN